MNTQCFLSLYLYTLALLLRKLTIIQLFKLISFALSFFFFFFVGWIGGWGGGSLLLPNSRRKFLLPVLRSERSAVDKTIMATNKFSISLVSPRPYTRSVESHNILGVYRRNNETPLGFCVSENTQKAYKSFLVFSQHLSGVYCAGRTLESVVYFLIKQLIANKRSSSFFSLRLYHQQATFVFGV